MTTEIKIKQIAESITEVMIAEWLKKDGDFIKMDEPLCSLETDKATVELTAETSGVLKILLPQGTVVKIGGVIGVINTSAVPVDTALSKTKPQMFPELPTAIPIFKEQAVIPAHSAGSGQAPAGIQEPDNKATGTKINISMSSSEQNTSLGNGIRREKMSMLRRKLAQRLVAMKQNTAMLTTFNEVNMSSILNIRNLYKDSFQKKYAVKLGFLSFFTKAICSAIKEFPILNAQINGEDIVYFDHCHVGIAISTLRGLVVPVIRNAETLSFSEIEQKIIQYSEASKNGTLSLQDMEGGTFTITNGGTFGSMLSTPLLNPPQSANLGMHNIVERPIAVNGEIKIAPIMYLALSYDHRLIDGRDSVSFLVRVKQFLEDPHRMFLET
jgi:2-oxoglutarate dehydrogenase E2 component (dihydrolipoamide succinyltransferase)